MPDVTRLAKKTHSRNIAVPILISTFVMDKITQIDHQIHPIDLRSHAAKKIFGPRAKRVYIFLSLMVWVIRIFSIMDIGNKKNIHVR